VTLGLLATLSTAYERMPADLVERKREEAQAAASELAAATGDGVILAGPVSSEAEGAAAGEMLADADVYAVVVVPTIATMAAFPWAAVERLNVPVVVWTRVEPDPAPADVPELVYGSGPVGATAIGNVLARHGRVFRSSIGPVLAPRALSLLSAARAAQAMQTAVFAHVGGSVWPGMLDVELDRASFAAAFGARVVDVEPDWAAPSATLPGDGADSLGVDVAGRSAAAAGAIVAACRQVGAVAGAIHCHGAAFAQNPAVGVVCCAASTLLASSGVPMACTGDDCTAVALFLAHQLGGAAQYLELDAPKESLDACLFTSGGEGDLRLARPGTPVRACENRFFSGVAGRGAAVDFVLAPGPVTLIAFTPAGGSYRVIAADAEVLEDVPPELGIPRGYVRFPVGARAGFDWWCEAGANHHLALTKGRHADAVAAFAEISGIESRVLDGSWAGAPRLV
jgi:L-fucose isomerase-like protein